MRIRLNDDEKPSLTDFGVSDFSCVEEYQHWAQTNFKKLETENESLNKRYYGLLLSVESVHSGETRHETALRYIQEAEQGSNNATDALLTEEQEDDQKTER